MLAYWSYQLGVGAYYENPAVAGVLAARDFLALLAVLLLLTTLLLIVFCRCFLP
jgi:hypothetical protein